MCFSVYINDASSEKCGKSFCNSLQRCCTYSRNKIDQPDQHVYHKCVAKCPSGCSSCAEKNNRTNFSLNVLETNSIKTRNNSTNCISEEGKEQCCEFEGDDDSCSVANLVDIEGRKCDVTNCSKAETDSGGFCQCKSCNECYYLKQKDKLMICEPKEQDLIFEKDKDAQNIPKNQKIKYKDISSVKNITPPTKIGYTFEYYYNILTEFFNKDGIKQESNFNSWWDTVGCQDKIYTILGWKANTYKCSAGEYLKATEGKCSPCKSGFYCPGVRGCHSNEKCKADVKEIEENGQKKKVFEYETGKDKGIIACPEGSTGSDSGASSEDNCYSYCSDNNWLPANSRVCEECPTGYFCTGGKFYKQNDNQGIKTCPGGEAVPYIDSSNDYIKKATFLNKYGNCQHCSEKYDQEHKEDTNKIILTQLVGDNIWFEHINNGKPNFKYTSSSIINTRTATKEEIINNKDNKYRNNYCKRNTNDLNSVIKCTEDGRASCVIEGKLKVPFPDDENNFLELAEPCRYTPDSNYD